MPPLVLGQKIIAVGDLFLVKLAADHFLKAKVVQGLPHNVPQNPAALFFAICVKLQGVAPCTNVRARVNMNLGMRQICEECSDANLNALKNERNLALFSKLCQS